MTVRDNICRAALRYIWIWAVCIVLALVSCTNDSIRDYAGTGVTLYPAIAGSVETVIDTRAAFPVQETTNHYDDALITEGSVFRVYAVDNAGHSEYNAGGSFRYSNGSWRSSVTVESMHQYSLYAFTPVTMPGASNQRFNYGITKNDNDQDVFDLSTTQITFNGLDILSTSDPMVCVAAAGRPATLNSYGQEIDAQNQVIDVVVPTVTKGNFNIGEVNANPDENKFHKVWLAMDHLYAKVTVSFCIDAEYHLTRDIRIKEARIMVSNGSLSGNHTYSFANGLSFDSNASYSSKELAIDLLTGPTANENRDPQKDYATLTEEYKEYAWFCFLPQSYLPDLEGYPMAQLEVTYDVYDRSDHVVRLNQTASNSFPLTRFKRTDDALITPGAADHFKVKVKVKPTYMYQLIDDDADITLEIINDTD